MSFEEAYACRRTETIFQQKNVVLREGFPLAARFLFFMEHPTYREPLIDSRDIMLKEKILEEIKTAMKAKDELRLSTLRMLHAAIKNAEIEKQKELTDDDVIATIRTMVKQYRDALADFTAAGREDLAEKQKSEIAILEAYLPPSMPEEEVEAIVKSVIDEMGATASDLGKVMGAAMKKVAGRADGNTVRTLAQKLLQ